MRKKLVAFVLALFCCSPVLDSTAFAQDEPVVPDWIPQNFEQAMEFDDTYGKTHIADGVICCVQQRTTATDDYQYETVLSGSVDSESVRILSEASYYFKMPDVSDSENFEDLDYPEYPEYFGTPYFYYQVTVYQPIADGTFSVSWLEKREGFEKPVRQTDLSFQIENGIIEETDCYGWLPDCIREFSTFRQENGTVSVHNNYDNYIVYCDNVCYDGGYDVTFEQSGTTELREIRRYNITVSREFALDGGTGHTVIVYEPVSAGTVKATWLQERPWETWGNAEEAGTTCFEIQEDLSIQEIQENQFAEPVQNDITEDGVFDILDVITLQKWLSGKEKLANWRNADLNTDGIVNIYDLCLLKKALLESSQNIAYSVLEQSWVHSPSSRIQDMEEQIHLAKSVNELQDIIQNYELCETCDCFYQTAENLIPEELNDTFFEDHAVIVLYSSAGSGDRSVALNKIVWGQQNLMVYTTTRSLYPPTPDMAYCRTILMIDKNDIANWTEDSEIIQRNKSIHKNILD